MVISPIRISRLCRSLFLFFLFFIMGKGSLPCRGNTVDSSGQTASGKHLSEAPRQAAPPERKLSGQLFTNRFRRAIMGAVGHQRTSGAARFRLPHHTQKGRLYVWNPSASTMTCIFTHTCPFARTIRSRPMKRFSRGDGKIICTHWY